MVLLNISINHNIYFTPIIITPRYRGQLLLLLFYDMYPKHQTNVIVIYINRHIVLN